MRNKFRLETRHYIQILTKLHFNLMRTKMMLRSVSWGYKDHNYVTAGLVNKILPFRILYGVLKTPDKSIMDEL